VPAGEEWTAVPSDAGDLRACLWGADLAQTPRPGVVLVDGSGDGACDDWGEWPQRFVDCGAVVLGYDKPGCGGSPGDWTTQSFADRARESLAALRVLRAHQAVAGQPVGLLGFSQGGWVALLAATLEQAPIDYVVSVSGPGVGPAAQDRYRIERDLIARGTPDGEVAEALSWIDERAARLSAGEEIAQVLADQERLAEHPWYEGATQYFDNPVALGFLARILDFDPLPVLDQVRCPVLALFGGADTLVPAAASVAAFATHLRDGADGKHGLAVFPGADHGLFIADPDPNVPRTNQLAKGFLPMVASFLAAQASAPNLEKEPIA
jgi:uncharacterized protein